MCNIVFAGLLHRPLADLVLYMHVLSLCKKASNHHANLPLEMYSFTL